MFPRNRRSPLLIVGAALAFILGAVFAFWPADAQRPPQIDARADATSNAYATDGTYRVQEASQIGLTDQRRGKQLPLYIAYPDAKGPFPVIIFSHGTGGSGERKAPFAQFWASHGYVVINPTHADSFGGQGENPQQNRRGGFGGGGGFGRGGFGGGGGMGMLGRIRRINDDPNTWINRAQDISLVIDSLGSLENQIPELRGKIDPARIGVGGHSLGAYTAQLIAGARVNIPGRGSTSFADNRVQAVLMLSGQGSGQQGLTDNSWSGIRLPLMVITGSLDRGITGQDAQQKLDAFKLSAPGNKYGLIIEGANHAALGGPGEGGGGKLFNQLRDEVGTQSAIWDDIKIATVAFWDA